MNIFCQRSGAGTETPLPHRKLTPLLLLVAAESFNGTALFAYVGTHATYRIDEAYFWSNLCISPFFERLHGPRLWCCCRQRTARLLYRYDASCAFLLQPSNLTHAGFIASMWFVAQFLSSFLWGRASDIYGHRPILLIGSCGSFISALLFGLSWSLPSAVLFRSINGLLNGVRYISISTFALVAAHQNGH